MLPCSLSHQVRDVSERLHPAQRDTRARSPSAHLSYVAERHRPRAVVPTIGAPPRNRRRERNVDVGGRLTVKFDGRQLLIVTGIGESVDLCLPTQSSQPDDAMI
jgi:hypothetical protein